MFVFYPEYYVDTILKPFYSIIRKYDPQGRKYKVIGGTFNIHPNFVEYKYFLDKLQDSCFYNVVQRYRKFLVEDEAYNYLDVIGINYYTILRNNYMREDTTIIDPPFQLNPYCDIVGGHVIYPLRDLMDTLYSIKLEAGCQNVPIWIMEMGFPTVNDAGDTTCIPKECCVDYPIQAEYLSSAWKALEQLPDELRPERVYIFRSIDYLTKIPVQDDTLTAEMTHGIINQDGHPKPAFYVYQNLIKGSKIPPLLSWDAKSTYGNNSQKMVVQSITSNLKKISLVYQSEGKIYYVYTYYRTRTGSWSDRVCINVIGGDTIYGDMPVICANSERIFVLFRSQDHSKVYLTSSQDGYNWDSPVAIYSTVPGISAIKSISLACTDNNVNVALDVVLIVEVNSVPRKEVSIIYGRSDPKSFYNFFRWDTLRSSVNPKDNVSVALLSDRIPVISWQENGKVCLITKNEETGEWTDIYLISQDDIDCRHPAIDVDEKDRVHVVWETNNEIHYLFADYNGKGFDIPEPKRWVIGESQGYGYPVVTHYGGNVYIVWSKSFDIADNSFLDSQGEIILAEFSDGQIWRNRITYTALDSKYPSLAVTDERSLNLIWTEGGYGSYRVAYETLDLNPAVLVLEPRFGEIFEPGSGINIRWIIYPGDAGTPLRATRILLSYNGGITYPDTIYQNESLNDTIQDTLSYIWHIPDTLINSRLRIKAEVEDIDGRISSNTSGTFVSWWMASSVDIATSRNQNKLVFYRDTLYTVYLKSPQSLLPINNNYNTFLAERPFPADIWARQQVPGGGKPPVLLKSDTPPMLIVVQINDTSYLPDTTSPLQTGLNIIHRIKIDKYTDSGHIKVIQSIDYDAKYLNATLLDSTMYIVLSGDDGLILCRHLLSGDVITDFDTVNSGSAIKEPFIYADSTGIIHIAWIEEGNLLYSSSNSGYCTIDTIDRALAEYPTVTSAGDTIMILYKYGDYDIRVAWKVSGNDWKVTTVYTGSSAQVYYPYIKYGKLAVWIEKATIPASPARDVIYLEPGYIPGIPEIETYSVKYAIRNGSTWEINTLYSKEEVPLYFPHFIIHSGDSTVLTVIWTEGSGDNYKVNYMDTTIDFDYTAKGLPPMETQYRTVLFPPYPNPSGGKVTIRYSVGLNKKVSIKVYDITGRCVDKLVDRVMNPGVYLIEWKGTSKGGEELSPGVYFLEMKAGKYRRVRKISLVR